MMQSKSMRWALHVARIGDNEMNLGDTESGGENWIGLAQDRNKC
jgi:hypothetical protein